MASAALGDESGTDKAYRMVTERCGTILGGRYELVQRLAAGGMGTVFEARDLVLERALAVKVMHAEFASDPRMVERFIREAKLVAALASEHIVTVFDSGVAAGVPYFAMELLLGRDLRQLLLESPCLPVPRAVNIALGVCSALAAAHEANLIHRDLKPANIFVTRDVHGRDVAKVLDFGVAKLRGALDQTGEGTLIGTMAYMAPEQVISGTAVDPRVDIYALGLILYEALSGTRVHTGDRAEVLYSIVQGEPVALDVRRQNLPTALGAVVARAMARSPEDRYSTARQLAAALRPFAGQLGGEWDHGGWQPGSDTVTASGASRTSAETLAFAELRAAGARRPLLGWSSAQRLVLTALVSLGFVGWLSVFRGSSDQSTGPRPVSKSPQAVSAAIVVPEPSEQPAPAEPSGQGVARELAPAKGSLPPPDLPSGALAHPAKPTTHPVRPPPVPPRESGGSLDAERWLSPEAMFDATNPYRRALAEPRRETPIAPATTP